MARNGANLPAERLAFRGGFSYSSLRRHLALGSAQPRRDKMLYAFARYRADNRGHYAEQHSSASAEDISNSCCVSAVAVFLSQLDICLHIESRHNDNYRVAIGPSDKQRE